MLQINKLHHMDALEGLKKLDDESVDCVMTSPPYWQARDYGVEGQMGLESSFNEYLQKLLEIFDEVKRVLKKKGTCWINLGDCYGGSSTQASYANWSKGPRSILPKNMNYLPKKGHVRGRFDKCCLGIPERFMLAMIDRRWTLRNKIIWHKPNHMPSSVKDRFTNSWEYLFFFTKYKHYHFDLDAVRQPHKCLQRRNIQMPAMATERPSHHPQGRRLPPGPRDPQACHPRGKNPGDYWTLVAETRPLGAILGHTGAVKVPGGSGWVGHPKGGEARIIRERDPRWLSPAGKNPGDSWEISTRPNPVPAPIPGAGAGAHFAVYPEQLCEQPIKAGCPKDGLVLDPFMGSGTTAVVAKRLGRNFIGFELNGNYVKLARQRLKVIDEQKREGGVKRKLIA